MVAQATCKFKGMAAEVQQLAAELLAQRPAALAEDEATWCTEDEQEEEEHVASSSDDGSAKLDDDGPDMQPATTSVDGSPDGCSRGAARPSPSNAAIGADPLALLHHDPDHSLRERKRALMSAMAAAGSGAGSGSGRAAAAQQELAGVQMRLKSVLGLQDEAGRTSASSGLAAAGDAGAEGGMLLGISSEVEAMAARLLARCQVRAANARVSAGSDSGAAP